MADMAELKETIKDVREDNNKLRLALYNKRRTRDNDLAKLHEANKEIEKLKEELADLRMYSSGKRELRRSITALKRQVDDSEMKLETNKAKYKKLNDKVAQFVNSICEEPTAQQALEYFEDAGGLDVKIEPA